MHIRIKVIGRVQGVFYRASAKQRADELGIRGFARNDADGSVYIEAEAEEEVLHRFIKWCSSGPTHAEVKSIEVETAPIKKFDVFEIRR